MSSRHLAPESHREAVAYGIAAVAVTGLGLALSKIRGLNKEAHNYQIETFGWKRAADYWEKEAITDSRTGLKNERGFQDILQERLRKNRPFGLIMIDMNAFKAVNDSLGHDEANNLLARYGQHMRDNYHREDDSMGIVARFGGDEFAIIVDLDEKDKKDRKRSKDPEEAILKAVEYAKDVNGKFKASELENNPKLKKLHFGLATGGSLWLPEDGTNQEAVKSFVHRADQEMYKDKRKQKLSGRLLSNLGALAHR